MQIDLRVPAASDERRLFFAALRTLLACVLLFVGPTASAIAQDEDSGAFPDGLWVFGISCAAVAIGDTGDGIVLTRKGTQAPQSRCDFVQVLPGGDDRWAVVQLCTGRDSTFARLSSLVLLEGGRAVLASENEGELEFDRCPDPEPETPAESSPDDPGAEDAEPGDQGSGN